MTDREAIAAELERQIRPLIELGKYPSEDDDDNPIPPGYDCCGCSTYDMILDHAIAIVLGKEYVHPYAEDEIT